MGAMAELKPIIIPRVSNNNLIDNDVTNNLTEYPTAVHCKHCNNLIVTNAIRTTGKSGWCICCVIVSFILPALGCCCLIPLYQEKYKVTKHRCPCCGHEIGVFGDYKLC